MEHDPTCRCVILTGAGQCTFTVGADISDDLSAGTEAARVVNHALLKNDAYSSPIVAAVNGARIVAASSCFCPPIFVPQCPRHGLACPKSAIYPFGGRVPHRYGRESRRTARTVTALGRSCAGAGGGEVFSREHCGQTLVRHPDEGVHLAKFPGKLAPGIARIGAAEAHR